MEERRRQKYAVPIQRLLQGLPESEEAAVRLGAAEKSQTPEEIIRSHFDNQGHGKVLSLPQLLVRTHEVLWRDCQAVLQDRVLVYGLSSCSDEVNRDLDRALEVFLAEKKKDDPEADEDYHLNKIGRPFTLGGLAGFPFTGITGFKAFAHHVPDGKEPHENDEERKRQNQAPKKGAMFIIAGSHVGVTHEADQYGLYDVGRLKRLHVGDSSPTCGASVGAFDEVNQPPREIRKDSFDLDHQQTHIKAVVDRFEELKKEYIAYTERMTKEEKKRRNNLMIKLSIEVAKEIQHHLEEIIKNQNEAKPKQKASSEESHDFPLVILSGVHINWEGASETDQTPDFFLPLHFTIQAGLHAEPHRLLDQLSKELARL